MDKQKADRLAYSEGIFSGIVNILLFVIKYWAGVVSGSVALMADAWHTLSDTVTSLLIIIGTKLSSKPPDDEHPFGHGRIELVISIIIGVLLAFVGLHFFQEAIESLTNQKSAVFTPLTIWVTIASIVSKEILAQYAFYCYKKTRQSSLKADGWHHRSDSISSIVILIGILCGQHFWWADGVLGIIVALFILYTTYEIMKEAINPLLGEQADKRTVEKIKQICDNYLNEEYDIHHFHVHRYGHHKELTFHLKIDGDVTLTYAHDIATAIENRIRQELFYEPTIHMEPLQGHYH